MKSKIIGCLKKKVLLINIPHEDRTVEQVLFSIKDSDSLIDNHFSEITKGEYKFLSRLSEVTEEQCKELVLHTDNPLWKGQDFHYVRYGIDDQCTKTAIESFLSALEADGVLQRNPWDNMDERFTSREPVCIMGMRPCDHIKLSNGKNRVCECKEWKQAEANVFTPNQTLIFIEQ